MPSLTLLVARDAVHCVDEELGSQPVLPAALQGEGTPPGLPAPSPGSPAEPLCRITSLTR